MVEQVGLQVGVGMSSSSVWALLEKVSTATGCTGKAKVTNRVGSVMSHAVGLGALSKTLVV
jgi:hypothetical protein